MGTTYALAQRTLRANDEVDGMPPELRACVHEYGYAIVKCFVNNGVTRPNRIRQMVKECWDGARQPSQSSMGNVSNLATLDWLLVQAGAGISAATLLRVLNDHSLAVVPIEPSPAMVSASIATVANHDMRLTKERKHRLRLRAAVLAARRQLWPSLTGDNR